MLYLSIIDNLNCLVKDCCKSISNLLEDEDIKLVELDECKLILSFTHDESEVNRELAAEIVFELIVQELNRFTCIVSEKVPSDLPDDYNEY